jgi:hypothetical protein
VSDFADVLLVRVIVAHCEEYLVKEPGIDIYAFSPFSLY